MKIIKHKIKRKVSVKLIGGAHDAFTKLANTVVFQENQGIINSNEIKLFHAIDKTFDILVRNPFYGENAKKRLIPKEYLRKYDVDNLFIVDLPDYWRMIYTLESNNIEIIAFVLDIIDHAVYDKKFGFKKI